MTLSSILRFLPTCNEVRSSCRVRNNTRSIQRMVRAQQALEAAHSVLPPLSNTPIKNLNDKNAVPAPTPIVVPQLADLPIPATPK